jgi:hypothetical protein
MCLISSGKIDIALDGRGKKGLNQTTKVGIYGSTPSLLLGWLPVIKLLGWIPVISVVLSIWELILYIIGIRKLQEVSTERAFVGGAYTYYYINSDLLEAVDCIPCQHLMSWLCF